jgi:hypothetical protein
MYVLSVCLYVCMYVCLKVEGTCIHKKHDKQNIHVFPANYASRNSKMDAYLVDTLKRSGVSYYAAHFKPTCIYIEKVKLDHLRISRRIVCGGITGS